MRKKYPQIWHPETHEYVGPRATLGQKLFMPMGDYVIPVFVEEIEDIYSDDGVFPDAGDKCSVWMTTSEHGTHATQGSKETGEGGWPVFVERDPKIVIEKCKHVNQFVWIDEWLGHSVQINDEVFLTLNEALDYVRPSKKKRLKRRLRQFRRQCTSFIAKTWRMNGERHPGFPKFPDKKVYVRKK